MTKTCNLVRFSQINEEDTPHTTTSEAVKSIPIFEGHFDTHDIVHSQSLLITYAQFADPKTTHLVRQAIIAAKLHHTKVIFDLDCEDITLYSSLQLKSLLPLCDVIIGEDTAFKMTGGDSELSIALRKIRHHSNAILILKMGKHGCKIFEGDIPQDLAACAFVPEFSIDLLNKYIS